MSERAPYSRVYWSIRDDEKFDSIRGDDHHLATWLRLLITADMAYPASADLPAKARRASVKALVDAGLVDLMPDGMYRVRGLTAERERRREAATSRGPNGTRTVPKRSANGDLDETRRDETSKADARATEWDDGRADLEAFLLVTRRAPTPRQRQLLDGVLDRHDLTGPQWAADIMLRHPDDPIGAVIEADKAWRDERIAAARAVEKPKPKIRRAPGLPESTRELLDHWAATNGIKEHA